MHQVGSYNYAIINLNPLSPIIFSLQDDLHVLREHVRCAVTRQIFIFRTIFHNAFQADLSEEFQNLSENYLRTVRTHCLERTFSSVMYAEITFIKIPIWTLNKMLSNHN